MHIGEHHLKVGRHEEKGTWQQKEEKEKEDNIYNFQHLT
jgi:hypothetical protein